MGIEDVDIVEPHALEALVEAGEQIFAAAPFAVRPGPHAVAGLGGDHQLVAQAVEIGAQDLAEQRLGGAGRRAVIVGEIEMRDAEVEGRAADLARGRRRLVLAEIVPEPERDRRQHQAAAAAPVVEHRRHSGSRRADRPSFPPGFSDPVDQAKRVMTPMPSPSNASMAISAAGASSRLRCLPTSFCGASLPVRIISIMSP